MHSFRLTLHRRRIAAGVLLVLAVLGLGGVIYPTEAAASTTCATSAIPPYKPASTQKTTLKPFDQRTTAPPTINFATSRASKQIAPFTFAVAGPLPQVTGISWQLLLVDGNKQFPENHVSAKFSESIGTLQVSLCLTAAGVDAGSYSGGLTFAGSEFKPVTLPITVNLKDNNFAWIWIGLVAAVVVGVFVKWWSVKLSDDSTSNNPTPLEFVKWLRAQWVTVAIAVLGSTGAVYKTRFLDVASFDSGDRWSLWVATFTAVTTTALLLTAIGKAVEPKESKNNSPK